MSRLSECCSPERDQRIDQAAAYMLGLLMYYNDGSRSKNILRMINRSGFSQNEAYEALMILQATNIARVELSGCLIRSEHIYLTDMARSMPNVRLFQELAPARQISRNKEQLKNAAIEAASLALTLV